MNNAAAIDTATRTAFDGEFDLLPIRAHLDFGAVSAHPTENDFHLAVSRLRGAENVAIESACGAITWGVAAARWQVEAIRTRRAHPGVAVNTPELLARVSAALVEWSRSAD